MDMEVFDVGRKKRLAELTNVSRRARFGSVQPISGSDFVREVSQAPSDVWVIVHLYKDGLDFLFHTTFQSVALAIGRVVCITKVVVVVLNHQNIPQLTVFYFALAVCKSLWLWLC